MNVSSTLKQLREMYPQDVRIVFKNFLIHENARPLHLAGCAANMQGRFYEMEPLLWEKAYKARDMSVENVIKLAGEAGLNVEQFKTDLNSEKCAQDLQQDQQILSRYGVNGTPAFFINGRSYPGGGGVDRFKPIVEAEIKRYDEAMAKGGVTPDQFYQKKVVAEGKKQL